jgi:hypothetical protein
MDTNLCPWSDLLKAAGVDNGVGGWIFVPSFQSNGGENPLSVDALYLISLNWSELEKEIHPA